MSALDNIREYGPSSDECESDDEYCKSKPKKIKLSVPDLKFVHVPTEIFCDNSKEHKGRVRSFPHVRGNWASYVYLKYPEESLLENFLKRVEHSLIPYNDNLHRCDDFHISLSKTFVLKYHLISPFTKSLQEEFSNTKSFVLEFSSIKIYSNEEKTRTFIALEVCYSSHNQLIKISQKVDRVLEDFQLPLFYENPSFHMSIFWLNGYKSVELLYKLDELNEIFAQEIENNSHLITVNNLNWKIGNKYFQYTLK